MWVASSARDCEEVESSLILMLRVSVKEVCPATFRPPKKETGPSQVCQKSNFMSNR